MAKTIAIQVSLPSEVEPSHLERSVLDAAIISDNVTVAEYEFLKTLLWRVKVRAKKTKSN